MLKKLALTVAAAALAASFGAAPASANHTLCDNEGEPQDYWYPIGNGGAGVGVQPDGNENFVCVNSGLSDGSVMVIIRPDGQQTVCVFYTNNQNPNDDICRVTP